MKKYIILMLAGALQYLTVASQEVRRELNVGDTIPKELWHMPFGVINHPEGKDTIKLNDYRDNELIILDFWGEHCTPCHRAFFRVDGLPEVLPEVQFLLVNHKNPYRPDLTKPERIDSVLSKLKEKLAYPNGLKVPCIVEDTVLSEIFLRGNSIPHYVWIGNDGVVKNITKSKEVDYYNIRTFLFYERRKQLVKAGVPVEEALKQVKF